jgi:hypothetical protein
MLFKQISKESEEGENAKVLSWIKVVLYKVQEDQPSWSGLGRKLVRQEMRSELIGLRPVRSS